jgi:hypothetical protein
MELEFPTVPIQINRDELNLLRSFVGKHTDFYRKCEEAQKALDDQLQPKPRPIAMEDFFPLPVLRVCSTNRINPHMSRFYLCTIGDDEPYTNDCQYYRNDGQMHDSTPTLFDSTWDARQDALLHGYEVRR